MASAGKLRVGVVGLQFGASFVPIYQKHPDVAEVVLCDMDEQKLNKSAEKFGIARRFTRLDDLLAAKDVDAVHILTPVMYHVEHSLAVLGSGRHCACAVPMATEIEGLRKVIAAQRKSGKTYMMMETAVYTREFFYAKAMADRGEFGALTFFRGAHIQDLEEYHKYWRAIPPMHYATHAMSPFLAIAKTRAVKAVCFGSGRLRPDLKVDGRPYPMLAESPFPCETAIFRLEKDNLAAEVTRSLFQFARSFVESFSVYGDKKGFEWQQLPKEGPVVFELCNPEQPGWEKSVTRMRVEPPFRPELVPPPLAEFATGGHGGSHPHLVNEFIRSIVENRTPAIDTLTAADWTAPGICAHASALRDGEPVEVPKFA
jgi:predicted dehydrogenase